MEWVGYLKGKIEEFEKLATEVKSRNVEKIAEEIENLVLETVCRVANVDREKLKKKEGLESVRYIYEDKHKKIDIYINKRKLRKVLHFAFESEDSELEDVEIKIKSEGGKVSFEIHEYRDEEDSFFYVVDAAISFY